MQDTLTLQNGRHEQRSPWKPIPSGQCALFWDTHLEKKVLVRELPRYRYAEEEILHGPDGTLMRSLVEHNARVDAFCQKMKLIYEKVGNIAQTQGSVTNMMDFFQDGTRVYKVSELVESEKMDS